ncbi:MAG: carbamate kinase [Candidatus Eisenbacteria bacterium]
MPIQAHRRRAVVALGGNAITRSGEEGTVAQDYENLERSLECVVDLYSAGYEVVLTHGNGPQIGNQMIRVELARKEAPDLPLDLLGADIQGGLGYMIERVLRGKLRRRGLHPRVCCLLMMVEVNADDPSLQNPTKFVGPFYPESRVTELTERGWNLKEDSGRGWRRVVPSPAPIGVVEWHEVDMLLAAGSIVITAGGGGIPVARTANGDLAGVEAVIDKDLTSAVLALSINAPELIILTTVERVMVNYGKPDAQALDKVSVKTARRYQSEGHFPPGSMGPKIEAACRFIEAGGARVLITDEPHVAEALRGTTGTWITA